MRNREPTNTNILSQISSPFRQAVQDSSTSQLARSRSSYCPNLPELASQAGQVETLAYITLEQQVALTYLWLSVRIKSDTLAIL